MIEVKNLGKKYGSFDAVRDVSFSVESGEILGLLGPNGAGKTTIMKILTCYHFPSSGSASIQNYDVYKDALRVKQVVGYLPENAPLYQDLNVAEYLDFVADSRGLSGSRKKEKLELVVGECGLEKVLFRPIDDLSKGYRQRVGLAQAIIHDPKILILDEPTTGLDPNQIVEIRDLIRKLGKEKTVILSTHILQEVEAVCTRVIILNEGTIAAQGTTEEIGRELKGESRITVVLKGKNSRRAEDSAAKLPPIQSVSGFESFGEDKVRFVVSTVDEEAASEALFDFAVAQGLKILSMTPKRLSLEDIFIQLTREGGDQDE